jgi:hypothetical protein
MYPAATPSRGCLCLFSPPSETAWRCRTRSYTGGSVTSALPPSRADLLRAFDELHRPDVPGCALTVGARALAKHVHRGAEGYWSSVAGATKGGRLTGGDREKSKRARAALETLLASAAWANSHSLPRDILVHELRQRAGYGARWHITADGRCSFRGFLEPQMSGGHEKKWRH